MSFKIQKYLKRTNLFVTGLLLLIVVIYFALRLPNLTLQPIFADEAIYIRWAQVMRAEPTLRFLPMSDGKTPLFMWVMMPMFKLFEDPLFAGRFLSVLSGFATLVGVLFLGWKFFNKYVGLLGAFLIAIMPYSVFFDRMALVDSMLATFSVWALIFALLLARYPRFDLAMVLGYFLGGAILTKTPGMFNILVLPATALLLPLKSSDRAGKLVKLAGFWLVAVIIAFAIYNFLRLGPGFTSLSSRNQDYIFAPQELVGRLHDPFIPHLKDMADWFPKLLTIPGLILVGIGVGLTFIKRNKSALIILLWAIIPLLIQMAFLRTFTARYLYFSIPPLLLLAGWAINYFWREFHISVIKLFQPGLLVLAFIILAIKFDYQLLSDPSSAPLPREERNGYLEDWTAGYGFKEIAEYLISESKIGTVYVGTDGSFGTLPDGLAIYLEKHLHTASSEHQVVVIGGKDISEDIYKSAVNNPTYYITNRPVSAVLPQNAQLIKSYPKVADNKSTQWVINLFKVNPLR